MLHLFYMHGDHVAYDNESGALLLLDEPSASILAAYIANQGLRPQALGLTLADPTVAAEICDEIDELIRQEVLFKKPEEITLDQLYPTEPRIKSMCLHLCHDCNLRCTYCFAGQGDFGTGKRNRLSLETGKRAVDFLIEASASRQHLDIDFFGGEPLLNWDVVKELTTYCETQGPLHGKIIRLTLTTNALLLDDEKTDFINEHMKNVVLSIDGRPEIHDGMRPDAGGRGSYERVLQKIQSFVKKRGDKEYYVRGTYTAQNKDFSHDVLHLAAQGLKQLSLEPVVAPASSPYALRAADLPELSAEYEKLAKDYLAAEEAGEAFHFFHFNLDLEGGPCIYKKMKGCGLGTEYCAVTPEGDIYPCHQFVGEEGFKMGNVHEEPAIQICREERKIYEDLILPNKESCLSCWARYFCSGGCAANAWHDSGSMQGVYELGCQLQRKRLEAALWIQAKRRLP